MIRVKKLKKTYGRTTVLRVDDWRLDVGANAVLVGENGAGKTTLLTLIAGLSRPSMGTITIDGAAVGLQAAREAVTFVPDQPALFDDLTVEEQMLYVAKLNGEKAPTDFSIELIDRLDFGDLLGRFPQAMSKGQRQKAGLLVGTARPFQVLLLDEPTTGLDAVSRQALVETLAEFASAGGVVLSSTHDPELIDVATEIVTIEDGELFELEVDETADDEVGNGETADPERS